MVRGSLLACCRCGAAGSHGYRERRGTLILVRLKAWYRYRFVRWKWSENCGLERAKNVKMRHMIPQESKEKVLTTARGPQTPKRPYVKPAFEYEKLFEATAAPGGCNAKRSML